MEISDNTKRRSVLKTIGATGIGFSGTGIVTGSAVDAGPTTHLVESVFDYELVGPSKERILASEISIDVPKQYRTEPSNKRIIFRDFAADDTIQSARSDKRIIRSAGSHELHYERTATDENPSTIRAVSRFSGHRPVSYLVRTRTNSLRALNALFVPGSYQPPQFKLDFAGKSVTVRGPRSLTVPVSEETTVELKERPVPVLLRPEPDDSRRSTWDDREKVQVDVQPRLHVRNHGEMNVSATNETFHGGASK